jgi:tetratricopeptide (TPR) repeat protein
MPPFDREGALKTAEKALRQGRIDAAIAEYVRIVEAQPRDWNSANALGDLYVRASQVDKGIKQYTRIADHLHEEGFYPKAAALYKKVLKIKSDDEHSLIQSGEIAVKQGLLVDAKGYFRLVADRRRARGDKRGSAEIGIRIGTLDPEDLDARLGAARSAAEIGETPTALREYREVGYRYERLGQIAQALAAFQHAFELDNQDEELRTRLLKGYLESGDVARARSVASSTEDLKQIAAALGGAGRHDEVLDVLASVAERDPADQEVRASLAQAFFGRGDVDRARNYLTPESAGNNPALWLTLAEMEFSGGRIEPGRAAIAKVLELDASARESILALGCRLGEKSPDAGYPCVEMLVDGSLANNDYAAAAEALQAFAGRASRHVIALMRLVDVCVDGGLEQTMQEAQAKLADAYLEVGRPLEARIISEDLLARDPGNRANVERFRRALVMQGESDPDAIVNQRLSGESSFLFSDSLDLNDGQSFADPAQVVSEERVVIDLNRTAKAPATAPEPQEEPDSARSLNQFFKDIRSDESGRNAAEEAAAQQYRLALTYRDLGMNDEAVKALEAAAQSPRQRFDACSLLGRVCIEDNDIAQAVEWFERAAEAPAPTPDAGRALLYDLAETLEQVGEKARALAVFVELEAESGGYRDVAHRIERLSKVKAKG